MSCQRDYGLRILCLRLLMATIQPGRPDLLWQFLGPIFDARPGRRRRQAYIASSASADLTAFPSAVSIAWSGEALYL